MLQAFTLFWNGKYGTFARFVCVGALNTGVDYLAFFVMTGIFQLGELPAQAVAYLCGMAASYTLNRKWTFRSNQAYLSTALLQFIGLGCGLLLLSVFLVYFFHTVLPLPILAAKIATTAITTLLSFVLNRRIFKK